MKLFHIISLITFLLITVSAGKVEEPLSSEEKEQIKKEVTEQFNLLIASLNQLDAESWSNFFSDKEFLAGVAGTDIYDSKSTWTNAIGIHFSGRESQNVEPINVSTETLSNGLALLTSKENVEHNLKTGEKLRADHVFTILWKKGSDGWKIIYSHESWAIK